MPQDNDAAEAVPTTTPSLTAQVWSTVVLAFLVGIGVTMLLYNLRDGATGLSLATPWIFLGGVTIAFATAARRLYKALHEH